MNQRFQRLCRHFHAAYWRVRHQLPAEALKRMGEAVAEAEQGHLGEICIVVEASLTPLQLLQQMSARERALEVFAQSRSWDTEHNSGVLVYVLLACATVLIAGDRGRAAARPRRWWS